MSATFELNCPHCDRLYTLSLEKAVSLASRSIRCKDCGQAFRLPTEEEIRASAEEPAEPDEVAADSTEHEPEPAPVAEVEPHTEYAEPEAPAPAESFDDAVPMTAPAPREPAAVYVAPSVPAPVPPQVIYAMPPQTVSDIATIRKWAVVLGVLGMLLVTANVVLLVLALVRSR